jgi:hypothetical protein
MNIPPPIPAASRVVVPQIPILLPPISGFTGTDFRTATAQGGRFIIYQYCISVLVLSFKRSSPIFYITPGESAVSKGAPYSLISLLAGWWGIPWGPIWTLTTIATNLSGGKDVTSQILAAAGIPMPAPIAPSAPSLSPVEAAAREDRKNLIMKIAWAVVALLFLFFLGMAFLGFVISKDGPK